MKWDASIQGKIKGTGVEQKRRENTLAAMMAAFEQGGQEALTAVLTEKLDELETQFTKQLNGLEQSL